MSSAARFLNAAEAASRLGVSTKALRIYEQRGLIKPVRTAAGWRTYGPEQLARAREIATLRKLGLSLAQVGRALRGEPEALKLALAAHQKSLEGDVRALTKSLARVREMRARIADGAPSIADLSDVLRTVPDIAFDLPWPWAGERFELDRLEPITWLTGPLGSGKTKLALKLAEAIPGSGFLGLERAATAGDLNSRAQSALAGLVAEGASESEALRALLAGICRAGELPLVVDLVEQGLDMATQDALAAWLRRRDSASGPLLLMTRSTAMLDLDSLGGETIIYCPANHAPPLVIRGHAGAPGLDLVASCLADPEVRARTEGTIAWRKPAIA